MAAPRKDNVKLKIIEAAQELLKKKTFSDISLAEIADEAGISKGTLYYHYKSKTDIFFDITDSYLEQQWDDLIKWTENKDKDTSVHRLVKYVFERNTASAAIRIHLLYDAMLGNDSIRERLISRYDEFEKLISQKISERTDVVSADYLTWLILFASDGIIVQEILRNKNINIDEFINQSAEIAKKIENHTSNN